METNVSLTQQDKARIKQLKVIKKLQKRVKEEQRKRHQLASQLKRSQQKIRVLEQQLKEEMNK
jgi:septal ring factor EnvC (AmiA/AmiB activator)